MIVEVLDLREEEDPLAKDEADDRDRDDLEVLDVRRRMEMSGGLLGHKDSCDWEGEEVRAGVSGGSTAELLPL